MSNSKNKIRMLFYSTDVANRSLAFELAKGMECYEEMLQEFYTALQELPTFESEKSNWLLLMEEVYKEQDLDWPTETLVLQQLHIEGFCSVYFQEKMALTGDKDNEQAPKLSTFPKVLLNCTFMTQLDLSWNDLEVLPPEIEQLTNLVSLDLSCNYKLRNLPSNLANLPYLEELILYGIEDILEATQYTEEDPRREAYSYLLPDFFRKMKQLKKLDLGEVYIREFPNWIGELKNLESLLLFARPEQRPVLELTNNFIQIIKLIFVYLHNYVVLVPEPIDKNQALNCLALESTAQFSSTINQLKKVLYLDLRYCSVVIKWNVWKLYGGLLNWSTNHFLESLSKVQIVGRTWLKEIFVLKEHAFKRIKSYSVIESERKKLTEAFRNCSIAFGKR
ncbi:MAG: leucine-rich repeat domain-containing protein [Aureispira sp.]